MSHQSASYRSIFRHTLLLGGAQICQAIISLARGKLTALLIGPEGMGISSLLSTSSTMLHQFTSCGIGMSGTRELSHTLQCKTDVAPAVAQLIRRIALIGALTGAVVCAALSVPLSIWSFGKSAHWPWFAALSVAVAFSTLTAGETAILQSYRRMRQIAWATVAGAGIALGIAIPLLWILRLQGIVPALIVLSVCLYISMRHYTARIVPVARHADLTPLRGTVKRIVASGFVLTASVSAASLATYLINVAIRYFGSTGDVGLFQAANSISMQYAAVIFAALATDFFPRLAAIAGDNSAMASAVNSQTTVVSVITAPIGALIILTAPLLVELLLSDEFQQSALLLRWFGVGIYLKALSYPMGYISFVKENRTVFFLLEGVYGNIVDIASAIGFYLLFGLEGLGIAVCCSNALTITVYYVVNHRLYGYTLSREEIFGYAARLLAVSGVCAASFIGDTATSYTVMGIITGIIVVQSVISIRRRCRRQ